MERNESAFDVVGDWPSGFEQRQLPIINLGGTDFEVDGLYGEIRKVDNIFSSILIENLEMQGGKYIVYRDDLTQNFSASPVFEKFSKHELSQIVKLDPTGVALRYGTFVEGLPATDRELNANPDVMKRRYDGYLPVISLPNKDFVIDLRRGHLRARGDSENRIELAKTHYANGRHYFYYDFENMKMFHPHQIDKIPSNVVYIQLPHKNVMDPVAVHERKHTPYSQRSEIVDRYPFTPMQVARVFRLEQSPMRHLITQLVKKENKIKADLELKNDARPIRKRMR